MLYLFIDPVPYLFRSKFLHEDLFVSIGNGGDDNGYDYVEKIMLYLFADCFQCF